MKTSLENTLLELVKDGKLKKQETDRAYLQGLLKSAANNFQAAEANISRFNETAFKASYDGILQISRVILFVNGYRPHDGGQHKTTLSVAAAFIGDERGALVRKLDRYRKRRNDNIYHPVDLISRKEAVAIFKSAKEYYGLAQKYLREKDPQLKLFSFD